MGDIEGWPKRDMPIKGAMQYSWSGVGFPNDETKIPEKPDETYDVANENLTTILDDLLSLKNGNHQGYDENCRAIQEFEFHGRKVVLIQLGDVSVRLGRGSITAGKLARSIRNQLGPKRQTPLQIEQIVTAEIMRRHGPSLRKTGDPYTHAIDLAQFNLYAEPQLEPAVRKSLAEGWVDNSDVFKEVCEAHWIPCENPYYERQRDQDADKRGLLYDTKDADIVMVLDTNRDILVFQLSKAFERLLEEKDTKRYVTESLEKYSSLVPAPLPEQATNGLHWRVWLPARPDLDYRKVESDVKMAKSGVYRFGKIYVKGDQSENTNPIRRVYDSTHEYEETDCHRRARERLDSGVFKICSGMSSLLLATLDDKLFGKYMKSVKALQPDDSDDAKAENESPFMLTEIYVNMLYSLEGSGGRDKSGCRAGLQSRISLGDFENSAMIFRQLGLKVRTPSDSIMLYRAYDLRASETMYKGRKFVIVNKTDDDLQMRIA